MLVIAMVLQNFDVKFDDPNYQPVIKQTLTVKPDGLYIRVTPRRNMDATAMDNMIHNKAATSGVHATNGGAKVNGHGLETKAKPMTILYGSNTGTCQAFAQRLAADATSRGFQADVQDLDSVTNRLPKETPVIMITSSYEGQPPENAARFFEWLQDCKETSLSGVQYAVFGCGHSKHTTHIH